MGRASPKEISVEAPGELTASRNDLLQRSLSRLQRCELASRHLQAQVRGRYLGLQAASGRRKLPIWPAERPGLTNCTVGFTVGRDELPERLVQAIGQSPSIGRARLHKQIENLDQRSLALFVLAEQRGVVGEIALNQLDD